MEYARIVKPPVSQMLKSGVVTLRPGESVGEHVTKEREEVLVVLEGDVVLKNEAEEIPLAAGQTYFIPEGKTHDVSNTGVVPARYLFAVALFAPE